MIVRWVMAVLVAVTCTVIGLAARQPQPQQPARRGATGWDLPADADTTKNPLTVDAKVLASGKTLYTDKCRRCHGPTGVGDGPDADPDHREDMDLTNPKRADRNSDGVVFYKVWNGRSRPKMPAFKEELTKEQVWSLVAYVQSLRKK
jgi:mono/diheme cytochrome c family protein